MKQASPSAFTRLRRTVFARHSSPWSAWSRWATAPLAMVPVWTRSWKHFGAVAVWFAINPVVFPEPADDRAWSTRAMLGEEQWLLERPKDAAMAVNAAASAVGLAAVVAAWRRRPLATGAASATAMALLLVYWELMARYYEDHRDQAADDRPVRD